MGFFETHLVVVLACVQIFLVFFFFWVDVGIGFFYGFISEEK